MKTDKWVAEGATESTNAEWSSIVFAPIKDGPFRFCVDYWKLNALNLCDSYHIPGMDKSFDFMGDAKTFSTLDATADFQEI